MLPRRASAVALVLWQDSAAGRDQPRARRSCVRSRPWVVRAGTLGSLAGNLTNLTLFYGDSNLFNGTLPAGVVRNLTRLRELTLSNNSLVGARPAPAPARCLRGCLRGG